MRRTEAKTRRTRMHRARPVCESLEGRQLLSAGASHRGGGLVGRGPVGQGAGVPLRHHNRRDRHDPDRRRGQPGRDLGRQLGALDIVYGGTNAYSKIVGTVNGGGGEATLASIHNAQLIAAGTARQPQRRRRHAAGLGPDEPLQPRAGRHHHPDSGRDLGGAPLDRGQHQHPAPHAAAAPSYRILPANAGNTAGGKSGLYRPVSLLQHHRVEHEHVHFTTTSTATGSNSSLTTGGVPSGGLTPTTSIVGTTIVPIVTGNSSLSSGGSTGTSSTLEAGQSASITTAQGVTLSYASDGGRDQVLTNVSGSFTAQANLLEPLAPGQSATEPPAPPGIIIKANRSAGPPPPSTP